MDDGYPAIQSAVARRNDQWGAYHDLSHPDYQYSGPQSSIRAYYEIVNPGLQNAQEMMKNTRRIGYKILFVFTVCFIFPKIFIHMSSDLAASSLVIVSAFALTCWIYLRQKRQQYRFPPGPSPKPIVGNALDVPSGKPWLTYMKWSKEFNSAFYFWFTVVVIYGSFHAGDIIGLKTMSMHMIVLHKVKDAEMLLEKRSSIYSDRPVLPVVKL